MGTKIKKFLSNKNTVTMVCAILAVAVLWIGYNWRVNSAVSPIRVPYAKVTIQPKTEITSDMIAYMDVAAAAVRSNVITDVNKIIGYYSNVNTLIPEGSMFYQSAVVERDSLPDAAILNVPQGEVPYYLGVNMTSTYSNSMVPGNYIDIYVQTTTTDTDGTNKVMVGKLVENVKILAVKDSDGQDVFENTDELRRPSTIIFSVKEDIHLLLRKASLIGNLTSAYTVDIVPVPSTVSFYQPEDSDITTSITSEYLREFIEKKSIYIPIEELEDSNTNLPEEKLGDNGEESGE